MKSKLYVYEWMSWKHFLISTIYENAIPINGRIGNTTSEILSCIDDETGYFLFHINLTNTEYFLKDRQELITALEENGIKPINGKVIDTTKKTVQQLCKKARINTTSADKLGNPDELLIIKTNFNYAGILEDTLSMEERAILQLSNTYYSTDVNYKISSRKDLTEAIWNNPNLAIEKFIDNDANLFYRIHKLLNRIVITEVIDPNPIRKMPDGIPVENYFYDLDKDHSLDAKFQSYQPMIAQVVKLSLISNIDYAAFDIVSSNDKQYYIVDINLTPYWGNSTLPDVFCSMSEALI